MTQHIQGKDGLFAGSIGDGKTHVPTASPAVPVTPPASADGPVEPRWASLYAKYAEAVKNPPTGLITTIEDRPTPGAALPTSSEQETLEDGCGAEGCCGSGICTPDAR